MKKRVAIFLVSCMILSIAGCGKTEESTATSESKSEEIITETKEVEKTAPEQQAVSEEVVEELNEETEEEPTLEMSENKVFTVEEGMEKIAKLLMAHNDLVNSKKDVEWIILNRAERYYSDFNADYVNVKTYDGIELNYTKESPSGCEICLAVVCNYFYDYVNNNVPYYDFTEYIEARTAEEILSIHNTPESIIGKSAEEIVMAFAIELTPMMIEFGNVSAIELIEGDACTWDSVGGVKVAYEIPLNFGDKNSGAKAVFDADGNLLNLVSTGDGYLSEIDDIIYTFETN